MMLRYPFSYGRPTMTPRLFRRRIALRRNSQIGPANRQIWRVGQPIGHRTPLKQGRAAISIRHTHEMGSILAFIAHLFGIYDR